MQISGAAGSGIPASGVAAVVLNVTVTNPTVASYLTVLPAGTDRPLASNLNFVAGQTVPNRVIVKVGLSGAVSVYNASGSVEVLADGGGWFTDATPGDEGTTFTGITPTRILDARQGQGPLGQHQTRAVPVAGLAGVPAMQVGPLRLEDHFGVSDTQLSRSADTLAASLWQRRLQGIGRADRWMDAFWEET